MVIPLCSLCPRQLSEDNSGVSFSYVRGIWGMKTMVGRKCYEQEHNSKQEHGNKVKAYHSLCIKPEWKIF